MGEWGQKEENIDQYHIGEVVDNKDPEKLGRLKVKVPHVLDLDSESLPWASPINSTGLGGRPDSSFFAVPEIGSEVIIIFNDKDIYTPFYIGYFQSKKTHQTMFDVDYPESYGWKDKTGNFLLVNKKQQYTFWQHSSGSRIQFMKNGDVILYVAKDLHETVVGNKNVKIGGNETVMVGGISSRRSGAMIAYDAGTIHFNSGLSSVVNPLATGITAGFSVPSVMNMMSSGLGSFMNISSAMGNFAFNTAGLLGAVTGVGTNLLGNLVGIGGVGLGSLLGGITNLSGLGINVLGNLANLPSSIMQNLVGNMVGVGTNLLGSLTNIVNCMVGNLFQGVTNPIMQGLLDKLDLNISGGINIGIGNLQLGMSLSIEEIGLLQQLAIMQVNSLATLDAVSLAIVLANSPVDFASQVLSKATDAVRAELAFSVNTPISVLTTLATDLNPTVVLNVALNPNVTADLAVSIYANNMLEIKKYISSLSITDSSLSVLITSPYTPSYALDRAFTLYINQAINPTFLQTQCTSIIIHPNCEEVDYKKQIMLNRIIELRGR